MEMNMDNLYLGLGYEQQAIGDFWKMGFEAFKFNADFGFDILVHNLQRCISKKDSKKENYYFQVKSRQCKDDGFSFQQTNEGLIRVLRAQLDFKEVYLRRILEEPNSFLLCYLYNPNLAKPDAIITYFWLSSKNIKWIFDQEKFFYKFEDKYFLSIQVLYNAELSHIPTLIDGEAVSQLGYAKSQEIRNLTSELRTKGHIVNHQFETVINVLPNKQNSDSSNMYTIRDEFFKLDDFKSPFGPDFNEDPFLLKKYKDFRADDALVEKLQDYVMEEINYEVNNMGE